MSGEAKPGAGGDATAAFISPDDLALEFRVLSSGGKRRGLRLEHAVWESLRQIARDSGTTPSRYVAALASDHPDAPNLSALVRIACLNRLKRDNAQLARLTSLRMVNAILAASPAPGFALSRERRIVAFNAPFQTMVRRRFPDAGAAQTRLEPRLALDVTIRDIIARLDETDNQPVRTGFAIGVGDQRLRGVLNAIKAPSKDEPLLLAFIDADEDWHAARPDMPARQTATADGRRPTPDLPPRRSPSG